MKNVYLLIAIVLVSSCSDTNKFSGSWTFGGSDKYADESMHALYLNKLKENKIEYITEDNGFITFRLRDLAKVRLIKDSVEGREKDTPKYGQTYVHGEGAHFIELFRKRAEESNIRVEYQDSSLDYFLWEFKHRKQIYQIEQDVKFELAKNRRENFKRNIHK